MASRRRRIMIAIVSISFLLAACSDETRRQDHAACKLKALELYETKLKSTEHAEEQAYYVQTCMEAKGYTLVPRCGAAVNKWTLPDCYSRWLGRPRI
jgi:hypothetical protein